MPATNQNASKVSLRDRARRLAGAIHPTSSSTEATSSSASDTPFAHDDAPSSSPPAYTEKPVSREFESPGMSADPNQWAAYLDRILEGKKARPPCTSRGAPENGTLHQLEEGNAKMRELFSKGAASGNGDRVKLELLRRELCDLDDARKKVNDAITYLELNSLKNFEVDHQDTFLRYWNEPDHNGSYPDKLILNTSGLAKSGKELLETGQVGEFVAWCITNNEKQIPTLRAFLERRIGESNDRKINQLFESAIETVSRLRASRQSGEAPPLYGIEGLESIIGDPQMTEDDMDIVRFIAKAHELSKSRTYLNSLQSDTAKNVAIITAGDTERVTKLVSLTQKLWKLDPHVLSDLGDKLKSLSDIARSPTKRGASGPLDLTNFEDAAKKIWETTSGLLTPTPSTHPFKNFDTKSMQRFLTVLEILSEQEPSARLVRFAESLDREIPTALSHRLKITTAGEKTSTTDVNEKA